MNKETSRTEFTWYTYVNTDDRMKLVIMEDKHGQIFNLPVEDAEFTL